MNIQEANEKVQEWINQGDEQDDLDLNGLPESDKEALRKRLADKIK